MKSFLLLTLLVTLAVCSQVFARTISYPFDDTFHIESWESCGGPNDALEVQEITLNPDPPKAGSELKITVTGNLKKRVEQGTKVTLRVKYNFVTVKVLTLDVCKEAENIPDAPKCPVAPGKFSISEVAEIPSQAPPGRYSIRAEGTLQTGEPLFCLAMAFRL